MCIRLLFRTDIRLLGFNILFVFLLYSVSFGSETRIYLNGKHRFMPGDNPEWASVEYDDSSWRQIDVPAGWRSQGINPLKGIGWYRIHFILPDKVRLSKPGVYLGIIGDIDEVYLNGVKIGGQGRLGDNFVLPPYYAERLYKIPAGLLRYGDTNVLAVRVMNVFFDGGILGKEVLIGDYRDILVEMADRQIIIKASEIAMLALIGLFWLATLLLYVKGVKESRYLVFLLLIYGVIFFLESLTFYHTGLKTPLVQRLIISLMGIFPVGLLLFVLNFFKYSFNRYYRFVIWSAVVISVLTFFGFSFDRYSIYMLLWIGYIIPVFTGTILFLIVKAYRKDRSESAPLLIGFVGLAVASIIGDFTTFSHLALEKISFPLYPWDYGILWFLMSVFYAIVARYIRIRDRMNLLASKVLAAHEQERKRLARELHDGLGQNLLATKFNLQRVNQRFKDPEMSLIIQEIDRSIQELRDITLGLRPLILSDMGLAAAINLYSRSFSKKTGIIINVSVKMKRRVATVIEENLFRVYQEALSNIIRHAEATSVDVSLEEDSDVLRMVIRDNGKGFIPDNKKSKGIGLYTMTERAELMGGHLKIYSNEGSGTIITVEVPCND